MSRSNSENLPVSEIKTQLLTAIQDQSVVLTATTGSGKSTLVPGWFGDEKVLVVQPRRVACLALATWVAGRKDEKLGGRVGYAVRDDVRLSGDTRITFATPGVVLRWLAAGRLEDFDVIILDEFHERTLDVDLILALIQKRYHGKRIIMSATLGAKRIASYLGGCHLNVDGRNFPVTINYVAKSALLPDTRGLDERVDQALKYALDADGDILVFMPGKYEISKLVQRLCGKFPELDVLPVHGGLTLGDQGRVFDSGGRRKIIVATNVAETSLTIPGVGVVVDSGLVKRTRYINDRGYLTLAPVARDSADQRAGRAGRTGPGVCFRLWSNEAVLEPVTPPEMYRESLSPLILAGAACNERVSDMDFLDPPKEHAVDCAMDDLKALGALDGEGYATARGRRLFGLPIDAHLGNMLVEGERRDCFEDAVDLVAALSVGRPLFKSKRPDDPDDDFRALGCDMVAHICAVREGDAGRNGLNPFALSEARAYARRIRKAWGVKVDIQSRAPDRRGLVNAAIGADPRCVHVVRKRRGSCFLSNGGTEMELAKESAVDGDKTDAVLVLASMGVGMGLRRSRLYATCAAPVTFRVLAENGIGKQRVKGAVRERSGVVVAKLERVLAGAVIEQTEEIPKGEAARQALASLIIAGRWMKDTAIQTRLRLQEAALAARLKSSGLLPSEYQLGDWADVRMPTFEDWLTKRIEDLGVESGEDAQLLSIADFAVEPLPADTRDWMSRRFATEIKLGDVEYDIDYDIRKREVTLVKRKGNRKEPPSLSLLPSFPGFKIKVRHHSKVIVLR